MSIDTNCSFSSNKLPENVFDCGQVRVKLLSMDRLKNNRLTGSKGHSERTLQFIDWLSREYMGSKVLLFPILSCNWMEMAHAAQFALCHGFYCNFFPYPRSYAKGIMSRNEYYQALKIASRLAEEYPKDIFLDFPLAGAADKSRKNICPAHSVSAHIDIDGFLSPCKYSIAKIGSIGECSLSDLWTRQLSIVKEVNQSCSKCSQYSECGGGCLGNKADDGIDYYCLRHQ